MSSQKAFQQNIIIFFFLLLWKIFTYINKLEM